MFYASFAKAETLKFNGVDLDYIVRSSEHNQAFDKLSVEIEISLVNKRLPSKNEIKAVSNKVMESQPAARRQWVAIMLPKMKSNAGAYATDHRTPEPEGIKIMPYMLKGTPYESLAN